MTNSPGDGQPPQEPDQPGYWEQQGQPSGQVPYPPDPYAQQPYAQDPYAQPPYAQQPYTQQPYAQPAPYAQDHPKATTCLVLGILGIVICGLIAPFAWVTSKRTLGEIDASQGRLGGRGSAQAGYVLGIIGTVLLGLGFLFLILLLGIGLVPMLNSGSGSSSSY